MNTNGSYIEQLFRSQTERHNPGLSLGLAFGNCSIRVSSNSAAAIEELRGYFAVFVDDDIEPDISIVALDSDLPEFDFPFAIKPPDPGKSRVKEEYVDWPDGRIVRKRLTGMVFAFGNGRNLAVGPILDNINQVVNFINNRYIQWLLRRGALLCHAAGVRRESAGLALAGFSGMGKSTLALHLMSHDVDFVSNDRLLIVPQGENTVLMHGVPKQPRINPGTALNNPDLSTVIPDEMQSTLAEMPTDELWSLEQKYDVMIDEVYGRERFVLESPMTALVLLNWTRNGAPTRVEQVDLYRRRDLLPAFVKDPGLFFEPAVDADSRQFADSRYLDLLSRIRVYEISGGVDFAAAVDACVEILALGEARSAGTDPAGHERTARVEITRSLRLPDPLKLARYRKAPELGPKLLFFSGGTALNPVSRILTEYTHNSIHIVTPFDSGGSSAKIRDAFDILSVGDLRSRLMALADHTVQGNPQVYALFSHRLPGDETQTELRRRLKALVDDDDPLMQAIPEPMRKITRTHLRAFQHNMPDSFDLRGASLGNLILVGGYIINHNHIDPVLYTFTKLVEARGTVRTIVNEPLHLVAILRDGTVIRGQRDLTGKETAPIASAVDDLFLTDNLESAEPVTIHAKDKVLNLIADAELICYPMGSFYSSIVANLLPGGVARAICFNHAPKVFVPNTGKDPEQFGLSVADSVARLIHYLRRDAGQLAPTSDLLNFVVVDSQSGAYGNRLDLAAIRRNGVEVIDTKLITESGRMQIEERELISILLSLT